MRFVKPRKPRGIKKSGYPSEDMCPHCYSVGCDPFAMSANYRRKIEKRLKDGVCVACGHSPCRCKSSLKAKTPVMVLHNNKKER